MVAWQRYLFNKYKIIGLIFNRSSPLIAIHSSAKWYKNRSSEFRVWKLLRWWQFYPFSLGGKCYIRHKGMKHQPTDCHFDSRMLWLFIHFLQFYSSCLIILKSLKTFWQSCTELHQFTLEKSFDLCCIVFIWAIFAEVTRGRTVLS